MRVEVPLGMFVIVHWSLVKAHGIREGNAENLIVGGCDQFENLAERSNMVSSELQQVPKMPVAADQYFEGPDSPERHERHETIILANQACFLLIFQIEVVTQEARRV